MTASVERVRSDFDRIALLSERHGWSHNDHYHSFLLRQLPARCRHVLEIGCGTGAFSRALARRADRVTAIDLSAEMVRVARERSSGYPNIEYRVADVLEYSLPPAGFDCIVMIATLHHLPMLQTLGKLSAALRPGGRLVVLDLYRAATPADFLVCGAAVPVNIALKLARTGRLREPEGVRRAWQEHGKHDIYPTLSQVRRACSRIIPGAMVRRHLLWRYSLVWTRA